MIISYNTHVANRVDKEPSELWTQYILPSCNSYKITLKLANSMACCMEWLHVMSYSVRQAFFQVAKLQAVFVW